MKKLILLALVSGLAFLGCQNPSTESPKSNAKAITAFGFTSPAVTGTINETAHTVTVPVPYGTNVTAMVPTVTQTGTSINPAAGIAQDFTNPVTYTVNAEDGTAQAYVVTVSVGLNPAKAITAFGFSKPATTDSIDETAHAISVTVPSGTDVTALVPTITFAGASINPPSNSSRNFSNPVTYKVTAVDGSQSEYTVTVTIALPITWKKSINNTSFYSGYGIGCCQQNDGSYLVLSFFEGSGESYLELIKFDANGNIVNRTIFDRATNPNNAVWNTVEYKLSATPDGGCIIQGSRYGSYGFYPSGGTVWTNFSTYKFDGSGNTQWSRIDAFSAYNYQYACPFIADNGFYFLSYKKSGSTFDFSVLNYSYMNTSISNSTMSPYQANTFYMPSLIINGGNLLIAGKSDAGTILLTYSSAGLLLSSVTLSFPAGYFFGGGLANTLDNALLFTGKTTHVGSDGYTVYDNLFVSKTDIAGNAIWIKTLNLSANSNSNCKTVVTADNKYLVGVGGRSGVLLKISPDGTELWSNTLAPDQSSLSVMDVASCYDGGILVTGGDFSANGTGTVYVRKLDSNGKL